MQVSIRLDIDYEDEDGSPIEDEKTLNHLSAGVLFAIESAIQNGALTAGNPEVLVGQYKLASTGGFDD